MLDRRGGREEGWGDIAGVVGFEGIEDFERGGGGGGFGLLVGGK